MTSYEIEIGPEHNYGLTYEQRLLQNAKVLWGMNYEQILALGLTNIQLVQELEIMQLRGGLTQATRFDIADNEAWKAKCDMLIMIDWCRDNIKMALLEQAGYKAKIEAGWQKWGGMLCAFMDSPYENPGETLKLIALFEAGYTVDDVQMFGWIEQYSH